MKGLDKGIVTAPREAIDIVFMKTADTCTPFTMTNEWCEDDFVNSRYYIGRIFRAREMPMKK